MFKIGNFLTLEPLSSENDEKYKCKLVERQGNHIFIDYPINIKTGRTTYLVDGMQFKASFVGEDQCSYIFETEVLGRVKQQIPMLILRYKGEESLVKIQRRKYFRVEEAVDVAIQPEQYDPFPPFVAVTKDISAGGTAIILPEGISLNTGSAINIHFVLPMQSGQRHYEKVSCKVIRIISGNQGTRNIASLEFINIDENKRQIFTRFCYEKQLQKKNLKE